jgi:hypothetical protein
MFAGVAVCAIFPATQPEHAEKSLHVLLSVQVL